MVGMGKLETTINTTSFITGAKKLIANVGGTPQDIADIYELMAAGKLNPKLTKINFEDIPEGIEKLKNGEVQGRLVAVYEGNE